MDKRKYQFQKLARRKTGYPVASVAYYGPTDQFASKAVVGITMAEEDEEVSDLRRWYAKETDIRLDIQVINEMVDFIMDHQTQRVAMMDRIIGCPHEEGKDYPKGEKCPQCPFWANRDRWTGEIIK